MAESCVVHSVDEAVEEIMRIHRSLPPRPALDEVEAAKALIRNVEKEDQARLDGFGRQSKSPSVPEELFILLLEMQKNLVYFQSKVQRREASKLLDLEIIHALFDEFIQRASNCISSSSLKSHEKPKSLHSNAPPPSSNSFAAAAATATSSSTSTTFSREPISEPVLFTRDDSYVKKAKSSFYANASDGFGLSISSTPHILDSSLKSSGGTTAAG